MKGGGFFGALDILICRAADERLSILGILSQLRIAWLEEVDGVCTAYQCIPVYLYTSGLWIFYSAALMKGSSLVMGEWQRP